MLASAVNEFSDELDSAKESLRQEQFEDAIRVAVTLLGASISDWQVWKVLAEGLLGKLALTEADEAIMTALELSPNNPEVLVVLGKIQRKQGKIPESIETFRSVIALDETYVIAMREMHNSVLQLTRLETSELVTETKKCIALYESSIIDDPTRIDLYYSLSHLYISVGRSADSVELLMQLNQILPECPIAKFNLAMGLKDDGQYDRALDILKEIEAPDADFAGKVGHSLAHLHITKMDFSRGWDAYECRWDDEHFPSKNLKELNSKIPSWDGQYVDHLLVWAEQGIGDEVMFASALEDANQRCRRLTVACDKRLIPVYQRSFSPDIDYLPKSASAISGAFNAQLPIGSLPRLFRRSAAEFPRWTAGYLSPNKSVVSKIRRNLCANGQEIVGISWFSNSITHTRLMRNCGLKDLIEVIGPKNKVFVCLQYGPVERDIQRLEAETGIKILNPDDIDQTNDIDNLCNMIASCDRVVSIDNATAHFGGALGVPTTVLLPTYLDWRWGSMDGKGSYWYPSLQFHHQQSPGKWPPLRDTLRT